jgi:hypothetical protein
MHANELTLETAREHEARLLKLAAPTRVGRPGPPPWRKASWRWLAAAALAIAAALAVPAEGGTRTLDAERGSLARAETIRIELDRRYRRISGRALAVTEASSTAVVESFTLLAPDLLGANVVAADNGIYFAICPLRATCPYPAARHARPASDLLVRRLALELALHTFLETPASVVAVSLPTRRFTLFIVERDELARDEDIPALSEALSGDPASPPAQSQRHAIERVTRPRIFLAVGLQPTPSGRDSLIGIPLWLR